jgi:hypothetical protein
LGAVSGAAGVPAGFCLCSDRLRRVTSRALCFLQLDAGAPRSMNGRKVPKFMVLREQSETCKNVQRIVNSNNAYSPVESYRKFFIRGCCGLTICWFNTRYAQSI